MRINEHEHHDEPFEMYSIAAMAFVIGLFLLWSAFKEELRRPAVGIEDANDIIRALDHGLRAL